MIRRFRWCALVEDVYKTEDGKLVVEFFFVKNAYKSQPSEIHKVEVDELGDFEYVTPNEVIAEVNEILGMVSTRLLEKFGITVESSASLPIEASHETGRASKHTAHTV